MRTIVATLFSTLDGVVESPHEWHMGYFSQEMGKAMSAAMAEQRSFLLGRRLYDEWAAYWPAHVDDDPFGRHITDLPKYVLTSRPLDGEPWAGTTVLASEDVAALKTDGEGVIGMSGCATTVRWLLGEGLLDELDLLVDPVVRGTGRRLFDGSVPTELDLIESTTLPQGVLHLRYAPRY